MMGATKTIDLLAITERCEKATGPDRELDAQIIIAVEHPEYHYPNEVLNRKPASWQEAAGRLRHDGFGGERPYPRYTASLDAAMTLVPEGLKWGIGNPQDGHSYATMGGLERAVRAATPALALCAASLRALAAGDSRG